MKINPGQRTIAIALLMLVAGSILLAACNNSLVQPERMPQNSKGDSSFVDSATSARVDTIISLDTTVHAADTTTLTKEEAGMVADSMMQSVDSLLPQSTGPVQPVERKGVLGYSYFRKMRRNETKTINVYVTVNKSVQGVIDTVKKMQARANISVRKNDTSSTYAVDVCLYSYLTVVLKDPSHSFAIDTLQGAPRQKIDTVNGNRWLWAVKASTEERTANLYLIVNAEKPDGTSDHFDDRLIPVEIRIDTGNWFRKVSFYLIDNPSYVVGSILVPLIAFFGLRYFKRRDEKKKNMSPDT